MTVFGSFARVAVLVVVAAVCWRVGYGFGRSAAVTSTQPAAVATTVPDRRGVRDAWSSIVASHTRTNLTARADARSASASQTQPELPVGPFGAHIGELKRRVEAGDATAAKALAEGYRRCEFFQAPRDQAEIEKRAEDTTVFQLGALDQVKRQAAEQGIDVGKLADIAPLPVYRAHLQSETDKAENCRGVDTTDARAWVDWQARAAELGDADAQLGYWQAVFNRADVYPLDELRRRKEAAAAYLQQAFARGDWRALVAIGEVLEMGYFAEPDPYSAHAYYFAAAQAPSSDISVLPWISGMPFEGLEIGRDTRALLQQSLQRTAALLDAGQIALAEQSGVALFAGCCAQLR
ncbi:MAG: hypothetical protein ABI843_08200 [Dokdonella sp.]